jgi:hypothetical protein
MDELKCSGQESDLESCSFNGWGIEDCSHSEDAGVKCGKYITMANNGEQNTIQKTNDCPAQS